MTIVADSVYLNGDYSKLANNTYEKKDENFSGLVFFHTLKGIFNNGWRYVNGKLTGTISQTQSTISSDKKLMLVATPTCQTVPVFSTQMICTGNGSGTYDATCTEYTTTNYITICDYGSNNPNGESPGNTGNPTTGGGGGGGITTNPTPPAPTVDPCVQAQALTSDETFKSKMKDLKSKTTLPNEVGYLTDASGNYSYVQGNEGEASIGLSPTGTINSYIHSHYTGLFPTFSGSDVRAIYQLQQAGKITNITSFVAGVVTASGTTYLMMVNDATKFATFAASNLNTDAAFAAFEKSYELNQTGYSLTNNNVSSYELALLAVLNGSGITILKGNSDFSAWGKLSKSSGNMATDKLTNTDCNY